MAQKVLFQKNGDFSLINDSIYKILQTEFDDLEIEVLNVKKVWRRHLRAYHYLINIYHTIAEYGPDYISGHKKWRDLPSWFLHTSYMSLHVDKYIRRAAQGKAYKFTLQTQSTFNGKIAGIPHFVYTDHTTQTNLLYPDIDARQYIRSDKFIERVEKGIYRDAEVIFTCGSLVTGSLLNQYQVAGTKVLTTFAGSNVANRFIENNDKYASKNILFVGKEWNRKGGPMLLKVFEKVLRQHPDASLTIIGCTPPAIDMPNCTVPGRIPADQIVDHYNKAAVFFLPTLREPFGIVFVEAMHYKLPVVANNIGALPDMVINDFNGYLVDNDADGYAKAICSLFADPGKARHLGENGFSLATSKFTWERVGKTMKEQIVKHL